MKQELPNATAQRRQLGLLLIAATTTILLSLFAYRFATTPSSEIVNEIQDALKASRRGGRKLIDYENERDGDYSYVAIHESNGGHKSYEDVRITDFSSFDAYASPDVLTNGCNLTVVLMDPRLPEADIQASAWYALESLATYAPYSCVVLQTSSCTMFPTHDVDPPVPVSQQISQVTKRIYNQALPMFRGMMERGLVRVTILDHEKYKLTSCNSYETPTNAWLSFNYWKDEFIDKVDSDMILILQTDSVICRDFDVNLWTDIAFVGAPWAPTRWYGKDVCDELRGNLNDWTTGLTLPVNLPIPGNAERIEEQIKDRGQNEPPFLSLENFCATGYGPGFNGGISLRNRTWMLRAIDACPHEDFGGISTSHKRCVVRQTAIDDEYFSIMLNALGAPMPTAYEAALFAVETFFAEQTREWYGPYNYSQIAGFLTKRWGTNGLQIYERMHLRKTYDLVYKYKENDLPSVTMRTIPLMFHYPFPFQPTDITEGKQVAIECKFLRFIQKN